MSIDNFESDKLYCVALGQVKEAMDRHGIEDMASPFPGMAMLSADNMTRLVNEGVIDVVDIETTHYDGIYIARTLDGDTGEGGMKKATITGHWDAQQDPEAVRKVTEEILMPALDRNISITYPHQQTTRLHEAKTKKGAFHIKLWSSPRSGQQGEVPVPAKAWGIRIDCKDPGRFGRWREGRPILSDEGDEVAACDEHNLYIYFDIFHHGNSREMDLYRRILEATIPTMNPDWKPDPNIERKKYMKACTGRIEKERESLGGQVRSHQQNIDNWRKELMNGYRALEIDERKLRVLATIGEEDEEKFGREYDNLLKLPKVIDVSITGESRLTVRTDTLFVTDPRNKIIHEIGKMKFDIHMKNGTLSIFNETRKVNGYNSGMHAPHVFQNGNPCYGNMQKSVTELLARYEFAAIVMMAISFLESVNTDDPAGKAVDNWPAVDAEAVAKVAERIRKRQESLDKPAEPTPEPAPVSQAEEDKPASPEAARVTDEEDTGESEEVSTPVTVPEEEDEPAEVSAS